MAVEILMFCELNYLFSNICVWCELVWIMEFQVIMFCYFKIFMFYIEKILYVNAFKHNF